MPQNYFQQTPQDEQSMMDALQAQSVRRANYMSQSSDAVTAAIGSFHNLSPYSAPGVALAAGHVAASGAAPIQALADAANQLLAQAGSQASTPASNRTDPGFQSGAMDRASDFAGMNQQQIDTKIQQEQQQLKITPDMLAPPTKKGFDWSNPFEGFDVAAEAVKGIVRGATTLAQAGLEGVQNEGSRAITTAGNIASDIGSGNLGAVPGEIGKQITGNLSDVQATTAYQQISKDLSTGEGWFPNPQSPAGLYQSAAAREVRGIIPGSRGYINGQWSNGTAWTIGRHVADSVFQEGTLPFTLASGLTDAAVAWYADPVNVGIGQLSEARQAAKLFEAAPGVSEAERVAQGAEDAKGVAFTAERPAVNPMRADVWLNSPTGDWLAGKLAADDSALSIHNALGKKVDPATVQKIVETTNPEDVKTILRPLLGTTIQSTSNIKALSPVANITNSIVRALPEQLQTNRQFAQIPSKILQIGRDANPRQLADAVTNVDNWAKLVELAPADREAAVNDFVANVAKGNTYEAANGVMKMIGQGMAANGVKEDVINDVTRMFNQYDRSLYGVDDLGRPTSFNWLAHSDGVSDTSFAGPGLLSERLRDNVELPDPRQVKRLTSMFGEAISKDNGAELRWGPAQLERFTNVWKRFTILRVATALRVAGDEQARLAAANMPSLFNHPLHYIMAAAGRSESLTALGEHFDDAAALGEMTEYQKALGKSFFGALRDPNQLQGATYATGAWYPVFKAQSQAKWVEGMSDEIRQLAADPIARQVAAGKSTDDVIDWLRGPLTRQTTEGTSTLERTLTDVVPEEGALYHGTSRPFASGRPDMDIYGNNVADNLMGAGFYTTDNPRVAMSYTSKGGRGSEVLGGVRVNEGGQVYKFRWQNDPAILDLEKPQPEIRDFIKRWQDRNEDSAWLDVEQEAWDNLRTKLNDPNATAAEQIKAWRGSLRGIPKSEADDIIGDMASEFSDRYDAFRYTGGVRTRNETHNAFVILQPDKVASAGSFNPVSSTEKIGPSSTVDVGRLGKGPGAAPFQELVDYGKNGLATADDAGRRGRKVVDFTDDGQLRDYIDNYVRERIDTKVGDNEALRNVIARNAIEDTQAPLYEAPMANKDLTFMKPGSPGTSDWGSTSKWLGATVKDADGNVGIVTRDLGNGQSAVSYGAQGAFENGAPSDALKSLISDWAAHPDSPDAVKYAERRALSSDHQNWLDNATSTLVSKLFDFPVSQMTRSPAFRHAYYESMADMAHALSPEEANQLIKNLGADAESKGSSVADFLGGNQLRDRVIDNAGKAAGTMTLNDLDFHARGQALDNVMSLLYDASRRSNMGDAMRTVFPFGQAFAEVLGGWGRVIASNPETVRQAQLVVDGARDSGFFYTDPTSGKEYFNIPGANWIVKRITGQDVNVAAPVSGLSIVGGFLPTLGPVAQIPASLIFQHQPPPDWMAQMVLPYGAPPQDENSPTGGLGDLLTNSLAPSWLKTATSLLSSPDSSSVYANNVASVLKQLSASGRYSNDDAGRAQMKADAEQKARTLTILQTVGKFISPSSPTFDWKANTKQGDMLVSALAKDYHTMQSEDYASATSQFINTYGEAPFAYVMSKTKAVNGGLDASKAFGNWEQDHSSFMKTYPNVGGYFGPTGPDFDYSVYNAQLASGERMKLSEDEMINQTQSTIARMKYYQAKDMVGPHPNAAQSEALRTYKDQLQKQYPGWAYQPSLSLGDFSNKIAQLETASKSKSMDNNDIAQGVRQYLAVRDAALQIVKSNGGVSLAGDKNANLRAAVAGYATQVIRDHPGFARVYDQLLSQEVE
jgi:hypothetical protein